MITRRDALLIFCTFCGCARPVESSRDLAPASLEGGWKLESSQPETSDPPPEAIRSLGLRRRVRAVYQGRARLTVTIYEMTTSAGAFEAMQKWRPEKNSLASYQGSYFFVIEAPDADSAARNAAARSLERALESASP